MRCFGSLLLLALFPSLLPARHEGAGCGTTRDTATESLFLHRQSLRARQKRAALASPHPPNDRDIGNIAIIEDTGGVVEKLNQFNLNGSSVTFTPDSPAATTYRYTTGSGGYEPDAAAQGAPLIALADDDARQATLPFVFPFYGAVYRTIWVNSDGDLTFISPESASTSRSTGRVTGGPPRIAALFDDLDPSQTAGGVRIFADSAHIVFSWVAVPEWTTYGSGAPQTFQAKLYPDGRIVFAYASTAPTTAVVGIAPGSVQGSPSLVSFKNDPSADYSAAILERFGDSLEIDTVLAAQRFFQAHDDAYDYLVIYNNANINAMSGAIAYESTIRSTGSGWGAPEIDIGSQYGSRSRLRSVINMGQLTQYPADPKGIVPARAPSHDTPLTVLGHEAGHLYLALASIPDPADPNGRPMLGYGGVHWSFVFNSEASLDEGERIADLGPASPRFLTTDVTQGYSPLDQYLMGFRAPEAVPPTFLVTDYSAGILPTYHPSQGVPFDGKRLDVTVEDVVHAEGRRTPDYTVAQRRFRFAFILIVPAGSQPAPADLQQVDTYRQQFEGFFAAASSGNAAADTTLKHALTLSVSPSAGLIAGASGAASIAVQTAPRSDLTIQLQTANGYASAPASVRIPAAQTAASFTLTGLNSGVEELTATALDPGYETAFARIQIAGESQAHLFAALSDSGGVAVRLTDINNLPYPGVAITAASSPGGAVTPPVASTDTSGRATFHWTPGGAPESRLQLAVQAQPAISTLLSAGPAALAVGAAVNAASFSPGLVPGALATVFGAHLAGATIAINGAKLTPIYTSDTQINLYIPLDTPLGSARITVTLPTGVQTGFDAVVMPVQPGIFAAVQRDRYLEIYCTGLGSATPAVFFGATPVKPLYSGPAPGWTGLDQVNVAIPAGLSGPAALVISAGGIVSNSIQLMLQ